MVGPERPVLLRVEGVAKAYGTDSARTAVLESVDIVVRDHEKVSLVGASGSGKSTLLSLIAGLIRPDSRADQHRRQRTERPRRRRAGSAARRSRSASSSSRTTSSRS